MARIISVSNHKGGVGKTTIVANLGFSLARFFKILLVDMDPQANLSSGLGFGNCDENLGKYFKEKIHFRSPLIKPSVINAYIDIIPVKTDLLKIENQLHETIRGENMLCEILAPLKSNYDLILLDCPPAFNLLTINALNCSSLILVPAKPEVFSIHGIELIKSFAEEKNIPFKIIFNQVNTRSLLHQRIMNDAVHHFQTNLLQSSIRNTVALAEAFGHAQDIFHYRHESIGATDFTKVADELTAFV